MLSPLQDLLWKSSRSYSLLKHLTLNPTEELYVFIFLKNLRGRILWAVIIIALQSLANFAHLQEMYSTSKLNSSF